jgi:hypothetical protein
MIMAISLHLMDNEYQFMNIVEQLSRFDKVWSSHLDHNISPGGLHLSALNASGDQYTWSVGDLAGHISPVPVFDVVEATWVHKKTSSWVAMG